MYDENQRLESHNLPTISSVVENFCGIDESDSKIVSAMVDHHSDLSQDRLF
jgi:hypothetical protein